MKIIFDETEKSVKMTLESEGEKVTFNLLPKTDRDYIIEILEEFAKMLKSINK